MRARPALQTQLAAVNLPLCVTHVTYTLLVRLADALLPLVSSRAPRAVDASDSPAAP